MRLIIPVKTLPNLLVVDYISEVQLCTYNGRKDIQILSETPESLLDEHRIALNRDIIDEDNGRQTPNVNKQNMAGNK